MPPVLMIGGILIVLEAVRVAGTVPAVLEYRGGEGTKTFPYSSLKTRSMLTMDSVGLTVKYDGSKAFSMTDSCFL